MTNVVIAGYARSPFHRATKGDLARVRPDHMVGQVVAGLVAKSGVNPDDIEDLIVGNAFPEGEQGFNIARLAVFLAGLPDMVGGMTVNRWCGSSMMAVHIAAGHIKMGAGEAYLCAGVESMTRVPMGGFNPLPSPRLMEERPEAYMGMGETAENLAKKYQIPRREQDEFALASQQKTAAAMTEGRFADEIVPITRADGTVIDTDGTPRSDTTLEGLEGLDPAFDKDGSVTAGTSSPLTDGAAACLVCAEDYARSNGLDILARIRAVGVTGCKPEIMGIGPVGATTKALERAGVKLADVGVIELNEAFAAQSLAVIRDLGIDPERLNLDGGAIALGHPLGASGARITGKAAQLMKREGKELSLATMCVGGGQGTAILMEAA